jgi:D-alanyl-D-alanine carboxypeptidase
VFLRVLFIFCFFLSTHDLWAKYAAVVMDHAGNILHEENATALRHPASLTKKMTLYLLFEALRDKRIAMNTRFSTSQLATRQAPTKINLQVGESITVETCIKALVAKSANDVAVVVAESLGGSLSNFVKMMNKKAAQLGMTSTHFRNASGLPDPKQVTSALDMAKLAQAIYSDFPEYYHFFQTQSFSFKGSLFYTHNHMLKSFPGLDGLKTGFINASGFNISTSAVRYSGDKEHRLFVVVMGGQTSKSRDRRAAHLLETNFQKVFLGYKKGRIAAPGTKGVQKYARDEETPYKEGDDLNSFVMNTAKENTSPYQQDLAPSPQNLPKNEDYKPIPVIYGQSSITKDMYTSLGPVRDTKGGGAVLAIPLEQGKNVVSVSTLPQKQGLPAQWIVGTLPSAQNKKGIRPTLEKVKEKKVKASKKRGSRLMRT